MVNMQQMVLVLITRLLLNQPLTQNIFQIRCLLGIGLRRPLLAIVAMRGMSISAAAVLATTIRTVVILFGWCVSDSVFSFCLGGLNICPLMHKTFILKKFRVKHGNQQFNLFR